MPNDARLSKTGFGLAIAAGVGAVGIAAALLRRKRGDSLLVNDLHSQLNETRVDGVVRPRTTEELATVVADHHRSGKSLALSGARHAMGGQQFATGETLLDLRRLNGVVDLDTESGIVRAEAGIEWPDLVSRLLRTQRDDPAPWTIPTKQTGADKLTLGGAISANAHGRGLTRTPIGGDIVGMEIVAPDGSRLLCDREREAERFAHVIGGYSLFGAIATCDMQLVRRQKLERQVELVPAVGLMASFDRRIAEGFTLGDWQFAIDDRADGFLQKGILSCYRPVDLETAIPSAQQKVPKRAWNELVYLAHTDKSRAYRLYSEYYMGTSGQIYWSDTSQLGGYDDGYHAVLDRRIGADCPGSEMITELYVPRVRFVEFMETAADAIRRNGASVIYGTVRLIERDVDSALPWAKEAYACIIFNLHVDHTPGQIARAADAFRELIDLALDLGGSFYLTYHRWATRAQVERAYPRPQARFVPDAFPGRKAHRESQRPP